MDQVTPSLKLIGKHVPLPIGKNKHYPQDQAYRLLFVMSALHWFAEGVSNCFAGVLPQADSLLYRIKKNTINQVQQDFDSLIEHNVKFARRLNVLDRFVWIAVDFHDREYYGKPNQSTRGSKPKNGTSTFYSYATASIVHNHCRLVIAQLPYLPLDEPAQVVEKLLDACAQRVGIELVLFDRGFYSSDVVRLLERKRLKYVMPGVKHKNIQKIINGLTDFPTTMSVLLSDQPVRLVFVQVPDGKKFKTLVFCTNLACWRNKLTEYYSFRWGIETGYRCVEDFAAKTCSTHPVVRLFLFYFAVALYNAWVVVNLQKANDAHVTGIAIRLNVLLLAVAGATNEWPPPR